MKVLFTSLGCDKNKVDSEMMIGILSERGYEITLDEAEAEAAVVNTCCFIGDAKKESIDTIIELGKLKEEGKLKALIITGCLGQRYTEDIHGELPEVDAILGTNSFDKIADCLDEIVAGRKEDYLRDINDTPIYGKKRILTGETHYAYLKIAEGCNKHCSYCVIPSVRGVYRSVPMEALIEEAKMLVDRGVREIILVAQETTIYGIDLYKKKSLPELIKKLAEIEDLKWIRLLYCYPEEITDELIEVMKKEKKVCHYIDMPIQHASDNILKAMRRATNRAEITEKIKKIREAIPDIALRTTFITGFPGETRADHKDMLSFVEEIQFDRLGVFTYSREHGTDAGKMKKQVPAFIKTVRKNAVMASQQKIVARAAENMIGREVEAIVEGRIIEDNVYVGRTYKDAPEVDGLVFISSDRDIISGDIIKVRITDSRVYDLVAEEITEDEANS